MSQRRIRRRSRLILLSAAAIATLGVEAQFAHAILTFTINSGWDTQARQDAATAAMAAVVARYNAYGNFTLGNSGNIQVYYNSGVATADASYNNNIRFGGTYPNERVAQHESNHWLGSGTTGNWTAKFDANGIWTGAKMTALIQQFDGVGSVIHQSGVHFYGYGLNFDSEVVNGAVLNRNIALEYAQRQDDGLGTQADPWSATSVQMTASDPIGQSSFNWSDRWNDGYFAHSTAGYTTGDFTIRTPLDTYNAGTITPSFTFGGGSLTVNNTNGINGGLLFKGVGTSSVITVNNLILNGGWIRHASGSGDLFQLAGKLSVPAASTIVAAQGNINILSSVSGSGTLTIPVAGSAGTDDLYVRFLSIGNTYTGSMIVGGRLEMGEDVPSRFVVNVGSNTSISGAAYRVRLGGQFDFNVNAVTGSAAGTSWPIVSTSNTTYGDAFVLNGFDYDAGVWKSASTAANGNALVFNPATGNLAVAAAPTSATWDGDTSPNFSANGNWASLPATGTTLAFNAASPAGTALTDDRLTPGTHTLAGVTFAADAPAYVITGAAAGNGFTLSGGITDRSVNAQTINEIISLPGARTRFNVTSPTGNLAINAAVSGAGGIGKAGPGTLTLAGTNTYTNQTRIDGGTLSLTGSINAAGSLAVGGGTFTYARVGTSTQTVAGLNVFAGSSGVANTINTATLALGAISRYDGGAVTFLNTGTITTTAANTNGILGAWAFVGTGAATQYATNTGGVISPYTGATLEPGTGAFGGIPAGDTGTVNYAVTSSTFGAMGSNRVVNTIVYTGPSAVTQAGANACSLTANGILNSGGGTLTIGGTPKVDVYVGSTLELVVNTASANVVLNNRVFDNAAGASGLTKVGPGTLVLNDINGYTGKTVIGGGTLQIGSGGTGASLVSPFIVNRSTLVFNHSDAQTFAGEINGDGGLIKAGTGTITFSGVNNTTGDVSALGGGFIVASTGALGPQNNFTGGLSIAAAAKVSFQNAGTQTLSGNIGGGGELNSTATRLVVSRLNNLGKLTVAAGVTQFASAAGSLGVSTVGTLAVSGTGAVDLTNDALIVDYTGTSPRGALETQVAAGATGSTTPAIRSTTAVVGIVDAADLGGAGSFDGMAYDSTSTLLRATLAGDSNLDRTIDTLDFATLIAGFDGPSARWASGDYNYSGGVNSVDFNLLAANFGKTFGVAAGELPVAAPGAVVPEPGVIGVVGVIGMSMTLHRRRRCNFALARPLAAG